MGHLNAIFGELARRRTEARQHLLDVHAGGIGLREQTEALVEREAHLSQRPAELRHRLRLLRDAQAKLLTRRIHLVEQSTPLRRRDLPALQDTPKVSRADRRLRANLGGARQLRRQVLQVHARRACHLAQLTHSPGNLAHR